MVALHRPLHTPINPGLLCNCRAETVPAHRTVITRATKSVALVFLPMIALLSSKRAADAKASACKLLFRWSDRPWVPDAAPSGPTKDLADARTVTRFGSAASACARGEQLSFHLQLPGGDRSRAKNSRGNCCQECIFNCFAHDSLFLSVLRVRRRIEIRLFCWLGCNEPAYACGGIGVVEDASAAQNVGAGLCLAAEMVLASCVLHTQRQLASGNRSRTENSAGHRRKDYVCDFLITHESLPFHCRSNESGPTKKKLNRTVIWPAVELQLDATNKTRWLLPAQRRRCNRWRIVWKRCSCRGRQSPWLCSAVAARKPFPRKEQR